MTRYARLLVAFITLAALAAGRRRPTPTPTATPTPVPLLRAAGSCLRFEPGRWIIVAEVGSSGRLFRIDERTRVTTRIRKGARVRILYLEDPDGPLAREILPGPIESTPTPGP